MATTEPTPGQDLGALFLELFARIASCTAHELRKHDKHRVVLYTVGEFGEMVDAMFNEADGKTPDEPSRDEAVDLSVCSICNFQINGGTDAMAFVLTALRKVAKWEANVRKEQAAQSGATES